LNTANYNAPTLDDPLRPTRVEVSLDALTRNLAAIRAHINGAKVMAVIKANAYGHGLLPVAHHLMQNGADSLGVAFLEEGIALRNAGITTPILVFGGIGESWKGCFVGGDLLVHAVTIGPEGAAERPFGNFPGYTLLPSR
jgi:alanine racemase